MQVYVAIWLEMDGCKSLPRQTPLGGEARLRELARAPGGHASCAVILGRAGPAVPRSRDEARDPSRKPSRRAKS